MSTLQAGRAPVTMRVPFAASSVPAARRRLHDWLVECGSQPRAVDDARIVISELVANAVRHARPMADGKLKITWEMEERGLLHLSVSDGGAGTRPRTLQAPSSALAGRGMAIVESLAARWWADTSPSSCTVHAVLRV